MLKLCLAVLLLCVASAASAQTGIPILSAVQEAEGATEYSVTLQLLALMTVLTLLPSLLLMMTSFTRIIIVLSLLRQALGTAQTPPKSGATRYSFVLNDLCYDTCVLRGLRGCFKALFRGANAI